MGSTFLCSLQAKDSDDEEEVVHVDRDHFMDEFFEQVTGLPRPPDPGHGPQPTTPFSLPSVPRIPCSLLQYPLVLYQALWVWPISLTEPPGCPPA